MISITEMQEKEKNKISRILMDYWKERGMIITQKDAFDYINQKSSAKVEDKKFFVIKLNKKIVGNITILTEKGSVAKIKDFVIKKEHRKKGYGTEVLKFIILHCKSKDIGKLYTMTFPKYWGLFRKFNFIEEGYLKDHYKEGEDLMIVSKFLEQEKQLSLKDEIDKINISEITSRQLSKLRY